MAHQFRPEANPSLARRDDLGAARGLVNGVIFTLGLWLAIAGFTLLVLR